jgi:hypothetical protein
LNFVQQDHDMNHVLHTPLHSGDNTMLVLLLKNAMEENRKKIFRNPFPNERGSIPNGGPLTQNSFERSTGPYNRNPRNARNVGNSPPNPQADLDAMALANNWMRMVAGDGSHLREQR